MCVGECVSVCVLASGSVGGVLGSVSVCVLGSVSVVGALGSVSVFGCWGMCQCLGVGEWGSMWGVLGSQ